MDTQMLEDTLKWHFLQVRERLERAASIGKAVEACAEAGNFETAIEVALDIELIIYEVTTFLNGASMLHRINNN